jgi:DNA-binding Lrp family transcriptional regulator
VYFLENVIQMDRAYMLISCEIGEEQILYSQLKEIPEVKNCLVTYGSYDIVVEFVTETSSQMNEIIISKIRKLQKIKSTITLRVTN